MEHYSPEVKPILKAAIYARVSTEEQTKNFSIENQVEQIRKYCKDKGYIIAGEYVDLGFSGTKLERPELTRLLKDASSGVFDIVLVFKLDRFFRDSRLLLNILHELQTLGIQFVSITESFDTTTPMGKAHFQMASAFAELERNTFLERSRDGTRKAVEKGQYSGGIVPYGYQLNPVTKKLEINVEESQVIKLIYSWLIDDSLTCYAIAPRLNKLEIPTRYGKAGKGIRGKATANIWRPGRVYNMLRNPAYKGEWVYGKRSNKKQRNLVPGQCPAIVSGEIWEKAQLKLKSNSLWADRNSKREYLLRGLIKCARCGHSFCGYCGHITKQGEIRYYRCNRKGQRGQLLSGGCDVPSIPATLLEDFVWEQITDFIQRPETVKETLYTHALTGAYNYRNEIDLAVKRLAEFAQSENRLLRLYSDPNNLFSLEAINTRLVEIKKSRGILEQNLHQLTNDEIRQQQHVARLQDIEKILSSLKTNIQNATPAIKRQIIETLVSGIRVDKNEDDNPLITIIFSFVGDEVAVGYDEAENVQLDSTRMPLRVLWRPF